MMKQMSSIDARPMQAVQELTRSGLPTRAPLGKQKVGTRNG